MNISFKNFLATKHTTGMRISLTTLMLLEIILGTVFLLGALGFDLWVYQAKVARSAEVAPEDVHGVTALNTKKLQEAHAVIRTQSDFILHPKLPLIRSPF